jgi:calcineurin-like phosphoesterase family protein
VDHRLSPQTGRGVRIDPVKLIDLVNFFKSPADRDIIARWTAPPGPQAYAVELPPPPDPERFTFLALGDTGDSAGLGTQETPQDAVARYLAEDAALPESAGDGILVLHTGDVVYMTGERRLYDRNFRRPYSAFLTPESTVDHLVFRLPFLPVPGNHDYYDYSGWATALMRTPVLGAGVAALARELFGFQIPHGGSDMGGAYMAAFVDREAAAPYQPGQHTRLPNRYYRFRIGRTDFLALDSNTLDAPLHTDLQREREEAARHVEQLEKKARALAREIQRDEQAVERWLKHERELAARDASRLAALRAATPPVTMALEHLAVVLRSAGQSVSACAGVAESAARLHRRWEKAARDLLRKKRPGAEVLEALDAAGDDWCEVLDALEDCFTELPEGPERHELLSARDRGAEAMEEWRGRGTGRPPPELCARLHRLSGTALNVQRELALERRRMDRRQEDYDSAQLEWLREALDESARDNPDGWRIVYLHQPLYSTIGDHSENADVVGVRENLAPLLRDRVHLVLAGHAHAFEWFRSTTLPTTGLVVTGGGGQPWLWRSILDPRQFRHFQRHYCSLRDGGATECLAAGNGPPATDGQAGALYHYVRVEVSPEALTVIPVGVRRVGGGYRREVPMPVYHVPEFPPPEPGVRPQWNRRVLESIQIRRGQPPEPRWK